MTLALDNIAELERLTLTPRSDLGEWLGVFDSTSPQLLLSGPSAVGKSHIARALADVVATRDVPDRIRFVQVHPGLTYEHMVCGIAARVADGSRVWERVDGALLALTRAVRRDGARRVLVLDDLHHVDVPTVFGETLALLDDRDRGDGVPSIDLVHQAGFALPAGVMIIATSQVLAPGEVSRAASWRRRFHCVELTPSAEVLARYYLSAQNDVPDLLDGFSWLNTLLEAAFGPSHMMGHGMFMAPHMTATRLRMVWKHQVMPLLAPIVRGEPVAERLDPRLLWPSLARE